MAPTARSQAQTHSHAWTLPLAADLGTIPVWGGRRRWLAAVRITLDSRAGRRAAAHHHVAADTAMAVARADAQVADHRTGRSVTTSHQTVARRIGSCSKTVQRARELLAALGLAVVVTPGRYLTRAERRTAWEATGRRIIRVASTRVLTLAQHLVEHVHLPRRGSGTLLRSRQLVVTKRARARAGAPKDNEPRPLWLQLLAAALVSRLGHLARAGTTHIGHLCNALDQAGVTPEWAGLSPNVDQLSPSERTTAAEVAAARIIDALDQRNKAAGLLSLPADCQHHPIALLVHQIRHLIAAGVDPGAVRAARDRANHEIKLDQGRRAHAREVEHEALAAFRNDPAAQERKSRWLSGLRTHLREVNHPWGVRL